MPTSPPCSRCSSPCPAAHAAIRIPSSSVGTPRKDDAVTTPKLAGSAVTSAKVKDGALQLSDFKAGQLLSWQAHGHPARGYATNDVVAHGRFLMGRNLREHRDTTARRGVVGARGEGAQGEPGRDGTNGQDGAPGEPG